MSQASSSPSSDHRPTAEWRRASASVPEGYCVEVQLDPDAVGVRDSKGAKDDQLRFGRRGWTSFLAQLDHRA